MCEDVCASRLKRCVAVYFQSFCVQRKTALRKNGRRRGPFLFDRNQVKKIKVHFCVFGLSLLTIVFWP
ncbi:hypothetical protein L596_017746 [Steinernema carpocapsae]|uniref:Uncharacterized protein n=1 Tax=Steinernema carpocapsae TaxID=34508 RepID=A0A4U5N398_STECR|nr:hypothetical protein L596_017746 [Steinernema carpocapsae]